MTNLAPGISLVIPVYDEIDRIADTVGRTAAFLETLGRSWELIVVADGGPSLVADAARKAATRWPSVRVILNGRNRGKGYSVRRGVLVSTGQLVGFLDVDLAQPIEALPAFLAAIEQGAHLAIGVRRPESRSTSAPLRRVASGLFGQIARTALALPFADTQCGMKVFEGTTGRELFRAQRLDRFAFDAELLTIARLWNLRVVEVPLVVTPQSSTTVRLARDGMSMLAEIARVRWYAARGFYKR